MLNINGFSRDTIKNHENPPSDRISHQDIFFKCVNRGCRRTTAGRGQTTVSTILPVPTKNRVYGETRGRTAGTQAPPSTRPRSTCCPPPPPTATDAAAAAA